MKAILIISLLCLWHTARAVDASLKVSSSDTNIAASGQLSYNLAGASATQLTVSSTAAAASAAAPSNGNVFTWKWANGVPQQQTIVLTQNSAAAAAINIVINENLGSQVAVTVTAAVGASNTFTVPSSMAASSAAATASTGTCGAYFIDCKAGILYLQLGVDGTTNSGTCTATIQQYAAMAGILQYPTSSVAASPYTAVLTAITAAAGVGTPMICATDTSGTNTLLYFTSTYGTATGDAQTSAYNKLVAAAKLGGINSNTAYYTANLQLSNVGGSSAPSAMASSLTSISKSSSRLVVAAGVLTTAVATLFGFAL